MMTVFSNYSALAALSITANFMSFWVGIMTTMEEYGPRFLESCTCIYKHEWAVVIPQALNKTLTLLPSFLLPSIGISGFLYYRHVWLSFFGFQSRFRILPGSDWLAFKLTY
ncbi:hypothetical protein QBC43DRAFT_327063 [Cladorrhinum sp. PSN259]|nr:hypothetical protein QBC43DRAFT_327063 [Cladorrhinum sp. PSN259]